MVGVSVPAAAQAAFGIEKFVAINCKSAYESCGQEEKELSAQLKYSFPKAPSKAEAETQGYTQAGGHVPYGITDFEVNTEGTWPNLVPSGLTSQGPVNHIRTDVSTGLATNPTAVPQCTEAEFSPPNGKEAIEGTGFFEKSECKTTTRIGTNRVVAYAGPNGVTTGVSDLPLEGPAYNLVQREGLASEFGVSVELPEALTKKALEEAFAAKAPPPGTQTEALEKKIYYSHSLIEGNVEWGQESEGTGAGDYHDYFNIKVSTAIRLISSRLVFEGTKGGNFITNATSCPGNNTSYVTLSDAATKATESYTALLGLEKCNSLEFLPSFALTPTSFEHDEAVGATAEISVPQKAGAGELNSSQVKTVTIQLPEGMTLNPAAAGTLQACTPAQARIHSATAGTSCPSASELGTVALEVPTLPAGSLTGKIYLGAPESGTITGPPYTVYVDAESTRYGVSVRLKGEAIPNTTTGQLTTVFPENPEQPFSKITLKFKEGAYAPIASPLACGTATSTATLVPTATGVASSTKASSFSVSGCGSALGFNPTQGTSETTATGGAHTSYTFSLKRPDGQEYLNTASTTLPAGLNGTIPAATQCSESLATTGACPASSQIGTATVLAGAGSKPYSYSGPVYLTGPYNGAPYGLSIAVPAVAGPFNLGTIVTRATLNVNQSTARVTVAATLPTIVAGIPLRLQEVNVTVGLKNFITNPTNCNVLATESSLTSTLAATATLSTPFQVKNCTALPFKPSFGARSGAKTSKAEGASLETTVNQPAGGSTIKSVLVQLPRQLPSRLTTLQKACAAALFAHNPYDCPAGSKVGAARAISSLLPGKLTGPAYLVARGGAAFPDLELVLNGDGVRVILDGQTKITKGITTTFFQTLPDVPVSSITLDLPVGPYSALAANGSLCNASLVMPTTITAQNGKTFKQQTRIKVPSCPVEIVGRKVVGNTVYVTVRTFAAGRISGGGTDLARVYRHLNAAATTATLKVPLSGAGLYRGRPFTARVRVGFVPKAKGPSSVAYQTVTFG
jgi:hypothetical protein